MPKRAIAQAVALDGWQVVDPVALEMDLALVGRVERGQQVQQRALARAALADDGHEFAAAQRRNRRPASTGIVSFPLR